jgi:hypothetical protein
MTDSAAGIIAAGILSGATSLGGLVKWAATIWAKAIDRSSSVIAENTAAFVRVAELLGRVDVRTELAHDRMVEVHNEISGVTETPLEIEPQAHSVFHTTTPGGGYRVPQKKRP